MIAIRDEMRLRRLRSSRFAVRRWAARLLGLGAITLASVVTAQAQLLPPPPPPQMPEDLPMPSSLYEAQRFAARQQLSTAELAGELKKRGVRMREDRKVQLEIVGPKGGTAIGAGLLEPFCGEVSGTWRRRADTWIPIEELENVARALPAGYRFETPHVHPTEVVGEGPAKVNSQGYQNGGADGSGMVIAIIDGGFDNLTEARGNGDAPPTARTTQINYTSTAFEADDTHGTGCVEAAYDHCPGATWRLYKVDSLADLGNAVDDCIHNNVDIISLSLAWFNQGWNDNDGDACDAANLASDSAILFFTSAGNYAAGHHWEGNFNAGSGDADWHDWSSGGDETNTLSMAPGDEAWFYLSWDTSGGTYNYHLYLFDSNLNILESSTRTGNNYEEVYWENTSSVSQTVHLAVWRQSGGVTQFEVFATGAATFQYAVASGSTSTPNNATGANVISVGAVSVTDIDNDGISDYDEPAGRSTLQSYSSRGPSNDGMTLPDICGPTDTSGFTYGTNGFGGTSCATPNVAGATCAFRSSQLYLNTYPNGWLMRAQAEIYNDWGSAGNDNLYGYGGARLVNFHGNTYWVSRAYGNTIDDPDMPFYTVAAAQAAAPAGGRIVYVYGGNYPEHPRTLNKQLRHETLGSTAVLGE